VAADAVDGEADLDVVAPEGRAARVRAHLFSSSARRSIFSVFESLLPMMLWASFSMYLR
jgi:hypothetical protein